MAAPARAGFAFAAGQVQRHHALRGVATAVEQHVDLARCVHQVRQRLTQQLVAAQQRVLHVDGVVHDRQARRDVQVVARGVVVVQAQCAISFALGHLDEVGAVQRLAVEFTVQETQHRRLRLFDQRHLHHVHQRQPAAGVFQQATFCVTGCAGGGVNAVVVRVLHEPQHALAFRVGQHEGARADGVDAQAVLVIAHGFGRHRRRRRQRQRVEEERIGFDEPDAETLAVDSLQAFDIGRREVGACGGLGGARAVGIQAGHGPFQRKPAFAVDARVGIAAQRKEHVVCRQFAALAGRETGVVVKADAFF